jgi:hypothetical protein
MDDRSCDQVFRREANRCDDGAGRKEEEDDPNANLNGTTTEYPFLTSLTVDFCFSAFFSHQSI